MGNQQSGAGGEGGGKKNDKGEKKKYEPPVPTRVGKKRKRVKGKDKNCRSFNNPEKLLSEKRSLMQMTILYLIPRYRTRYCSETSCCDSSYKM